MRLHSLIFAFISGVDFETISYDIKIKGLAYALAPRQTVNKIYQHLRPIIDWLID